MDILFGYRLCGGLLVLAVLLIVDLRRGRTQRAKEYAFLFGATAAAMLYGLVHDFVSWSISREYFVLGKGIDSAATGYSWETMKLAMSALWTAGLIGAASFLMANNPDRLGRQVPYRLLIRLSAVPLLLSIITEALTGPLGYLLAPYIADRMDLLYIYDRASRPFFTVWGMHAGAYLGGIAGIVIAIVAILKMKRRLPATLPAVGTD